MSLARICVLVAASGASWEARALQQLGTGAPGIVVLKRCVDLNDLLASAATGQAQVSLVAYGLPGLDADSVDHLRRSGLSVVVVAEPDELDQGGSDRVRRLGIEHIVESGSIESLNSAVLRAGADSQPVTAPVQLERDPESPDMARPGRMLAVWGPTGAPGRTTVAVGVAAELANRGAQTLLVDADAFGGAVAQHLGVLDEMSGLLAAARLANAGQLDGDRLATLARAVNPSLRVLTGLPRADRWAEVRDSGFTQLLELACSIGEYVVLDTAFCLETEVNASLGNSAPHRNAMTLTSLEQADEVIVVGSADPVGLARLARGLVELLETAPSGTVRIVINRARPSLGWGEKEVRAMIEGFVTPASVHFLPDDRGATDRALVSGKTLVELGDSALRRSMSGLVDAVIGQPAPTGSRGWFRRRTEGTGR